MKITLYSSENCCLCDQAKDLLDKVSSANAIDIELSVSDVRKDHDLYHLYGARIPVLKHEQEKREQTELGWPFDETMLLEFLK